MRKLCWMIAILFLCQTNMSAQDEGGEAVKRNSISEGVDLDEVVVEATKLKFYFDGDTMVYNADAFDLKEGAVLNDLLKQLPGIEIDGTTIYSNGKRVDALLLNGKDFFNKDRETILENLPHYMLSKVKVYDKTPDSTSLYRREREYHGLVMDVRLKKKYESTWLGNATAGYGTSNRYFGSIFGLTFNDHSRISAFLITNNTNARGYSTGEDIQTYTSGMGDEDITRFEVNFNFDHPKGLYYGAGSGSIDYNASNDITRNIRESYYESGNVYTRAYNSSRSYRFSTNFNGSLTAFGNDKLLSFDLQPMFSYTRDHGHGVNASADFNEDINEWLGTNWTDSINRDSLPQKVWPFTINHSHDASKQDYKEIDGSFSFNKRFSTEDNNKYITFSSSVNYSKYESNGYSHNRINYMADAKRPVDWRNQYNNDKSNSFNYDLGIVGQYIFTEHSNLNASYRFRHYSQHSNDGLYLLSKLGDEWNEKADKGLGMLPSTAELLKVIDGNNSHRSHERSYENTANINYSYNVYDGEHYTTYFYASLGIENSGAKLHYINQNVDTLGKQNYTYLNPSLNFGFDTKGKKKNNFGGNISWNMSHSAPSVTRLIDVTSDANPLYIAKNNPNLKMSSGHYIGGNFRFAFTSIKSISASINYSVERNQVATATIYDKQTGVTYATPQNINGNHTLSYGISSNFDFGKDREHHLNATINYNTNQNADLVGLASEGVAVKSLVHNKTLTPQITYRWRNKLFAINTRVNVSYRNSTSDREGFEKINAVDFNTNTQLSGFNKKLGIDWETAFATTSRRGYSYKEMNDDDFYWNAKITKTIHQFDISLSAHDILRQQKSTSYTVNGQGRMETYLNTIGRYCLLTVKWRFAEKKEKKGNE